MTVRRGDAMLHGMNAETFVFVALMLVAVLGTALPVAAVIALGDSVLDVED